MSSSIASPDGRPRAASATIESDRLRVTLTDGRDVGIPTSWYPWLDRATPEQRSTLTIIEDGLGIWWEQLDDGISVPALLSVAHV
jgi:Protein of unknown function (DUF2442)